MSTLAHASAEHLVRRRSAIAVEIQSLARSSPHSGFFLAVPPAVTHLVSSTGPQRYEVVRNFASMEDRPRSPLKTRTRLVTKTTAAAAVTNPALTIGA